MPPQKPRPVSNRHPIDASSSSSSSSSTSSSTNATITLRTSDGEQLSITKQIAQLCPLVDYKLRSMRSMRSTSNRVVDVDVKIEPFKKVIEFIQHHKTDGTLEFDSEENDPLSYTEWECAFLGLPGILDQTSMAEYYFKGLPRNVNERMIVEIWATANKLGVERIRDLSGLVVTCMIQARAFDECVRLFDGFLTPDEIRLTRFGRMQQNIELFQDWVKNREGHGRH